LPFNIELPLVASTSPAGADHGLSSQSALPPSFRLASDVLRVSASYQVKAVVDRSGLLRRKITTTREIDFRPLSPPQACFTEEPTLSKVTSHLSEAEMGIERHGSSCQSSTGEPPAYSPSLAFHVVVPSSKRVRPGDHLDLGVYLSVPTELRKALVGMSLHGLSIRLQTITTASVASRRRSHTTYAELYTLRGIMPLEISARDHQFEVPSELWEHHVYPSMLPSFQCYGIQRTHRLIVLADIVFATNSNIHVRGLLLNRVDVKY